MMEYTLNSKMSVSYHLYEDSYLTFLNPYYGEKVIQSINIILKTDSGKLITVKSKYGKLFPISIFEVSNMTPYEAISLLPENYGAAFAKSIHDHLEKETTEYFTLVANGHLRHTFVVVDGSRRGNIARPILSNGRHLAVYNHEMNEGKTTPLYIFHDLYFKHHEEKKYGYKDVRLYGSNILHVNNDNVARVGVIPYSIDGVRLIFHTAISKSYCISDFGGGAKKEELPIRTLLRECREEAGKDNATVVKESIESNNGTYVWSAKVGSDTKISMVVLTRVESGSIKDSTHTKEIKGIASIDYRKLLKTNSSEIHPPIKCFMEYITSRNSLVGFECSYIHPTGIVPPKKNLMLIVGKDRREGLEEQHDTWRIEMERLGIRKIPGRIYEN